MNIIPNTEKYTNFISNAEWYHGSIYDFDTFDTSDNQYQETKNPLGDNIGSMFTTKKSVALDFAGRGQGSIQKTGYQLVYKTGGNVGGIIRTKNEADDVLSEMGDRFNIKETTYIDDAINQDTILYTVKIDIKNPKIFNTQSEFRSYILQNDKTNITADGFDGVLILKSEYIKGDSWVIAFDNNQINIIDKRYIPVKNKAVTESISNTFISFVNRFKIYDENLVESIVTGYKLLFESDSILESNDISISDEFLVQHDMSEDDVHYMGSGEFGSAYSIGNDKVLKITTSKSEAELAHQIMNGNFSSFVKIYSVDPSDDGNYYIIQEELTEDSNLENTWYCVTDALESQGLGVQEVGNFDEDEYIEQGGELSDETTELMSALYGIVYDYNRLGVVASDIKADNMGRASDGTIKAFDIDDKGAR